MPAYQGGKARLGKRIYNVIKKYDNGQPYFEPFIGMGGVMINFANEDSQRELIACDYNKDLILFWRAIQDGWQPPSECSREEYNRLKNSSSSSSALRCFIGIFASYSASWFNGYRLTKGNRYLEEATRGLAKMTSIYKVKFIESASYDSFSPKGQLIYCDPPYRGNKLNSKYFHNFDHDHFWQTMREWSKDNTVLISEASAPNDFECIWESHSNCNTRYSNKKYIEKLFKFSPEHDQSSI
jgi:DNA adenine methylase